MAGEMRITKAEWDAFWEVLGPDWFFDDSDLSPENYDDMKPGEVLALTCGGLFWQGSGPAKEVPGIFTLAQALESKKEGIRMSQSLTGAIRRWQKSLSYETLTVQLPKDKAEALRALVAELGGKVL